MEPLTETITLDIDESNELAFKIHMEGATSTPAKVRLVCEGKDFSYMFNGYGTGEPEVVQFTLPQMSSKISEGTYNARVEVLVENRYFAPVQFQMNFKKTVSVVAESIQVRPKPVQPEIKVTATPVITPKQSQQPSIITFEQRPEPKPVPQAPTQIPAPLPPQQPQVQSSGKLSALKEAYLKKIARSSEAEDMDEDAIRTLARNFLRDKAKK